MSTYGSTDRAGRGGGRGGRGDGGAGNREAGGGGGWRAETRGTGSGGLGGVSEDGAKSQSMEEHLKETQGLLEESRSMQHETEAVGHDVLGRLGYQTEQLEGARDRVMDMDGITNSARKSLQQLARKKRREKVVLWVIITILAAADIGLVYRMITNHGDIL